MNEHYTIQPAVAAQAPRIATLIMEAMNHDCCQYFAGPRHDLADFHRLMTALVGRTDSQYSYANTLVAMDADKVVGIALSYDGARLHELRRAFIEGAKEVLGMDHSGMDDETQAGELYIDCLCVDASYRQQGIATALLRATCQRAWREGLPAVGLLVDQDNPQAETLYAKLGFRYANDSQWGGHSMRHLVLPAQRTYPVNAMQWEMFEEWSEDPSMTQYNLLVCVDVPRERCDAERARRACQRVLDGQRYLHIHLVMQDGEPLICEDWCMPNVVKYREMSDKEWEQGKGDLIQSFDLFGEPAARLHVVATPTKTVIGVELHHLFFDGLSVKAAFNNIEDALHGRPIFDQGDLAAESNEAEVASYGGPDYEKAKAVYTEKFREDVQFADICRETDDPFGQCICVRPLIDNKPVDEGCKRLGTNFAIIFNAAYSLALGQMSGYRRVAFFTTYHGRTDKRLTDRVYGNFLTSLPVIIDTDLAQSVSQLLSQTKTALFASMRYRAYPVRHLLRDLDIGLDDNGTELSVQGQFIYEYLLVDGASYVSYHIEPTKTLEHAMAIIILREGGYEVAVDGSDALYTREQLETLAGLTGEYVLKLASADASATIGGLSQNDGND
ncbi:MAG: GNAT family N-acetyltransferase [Bacteroidaceae bacterium]|nr:GNAT family N-acetyltransferase [Bacteroidaceae bacterium]